MSSGNLHLLSEMLKREGWDLVSIESLRGTLFDIIAKKYDKILLIKCVSNVDSIKRDIAEDLISIARVLNATPIIIAEYSLYGPLLDGVIYSRYSIPVLTIKTFIRYICGKKPIAYSGRGGIYVKINSEKLRELRTSKGYSLGNIAYYCNVSRKAIIEYEKGMDAELSVARKLRELFGDDIFSEIDIIKEWNRISKSVEPKEGVESVVGQKLCSIGLKVIESKRDPVNIVTLDKEESRDISLVGKIEKGRSYDQAAQILKAISSFINFHAVIFVKKITYKQFLGGVRVINIKELMQVKDIDQLLRLLKI
ncbi:MAG: hypothetical protein J7K58_04305 [Euryarchaeota archaeon]|nr:hypothetical protein [Euryarchaeota archaeon]